MSRLYFIALALIASATCAARPMIIHQTQTLQPPAGYYFFGYEVAIDGDWAIITAATPSATPTNPTETHDALLYHYVNGRWTFDRTLIHRVSTTYPSQMIYFVSVAMNNGLAAIGSNPTHIFKRTNNTWTEIAHPFTAPEGDPDSVRGELFWDGNTLLATRDTCDYYGQTWGALISRLNADDSWSPLERLSSGDTYCTQQPFTFGFSGNTVVAGTWPNDYEISTDQLRIFRRSGTTWMPTAAIEGSMGEGDVSGNEIFIPSRLKVGTAVYRNDDSLTAIDLIRTVSASYADSWRSGGFTHSNDVFVQAGDVFRKNAAGKYEHVAILKPRGLYVLTGEVQISGRRVISHLYRDHNSANQAAAIFDLPATYTPSRVVATGFENGRPPPFNPQLGTFAVATKSNGNHVYRQSSPTGAYRALLANSDWEEQGIEADIKPTAFSGSSEEWAGLAVRHLDDANYYAVALRSSGVVELRSMRNGVSTTIVQKPWPIVAGRNYHVSLQAYATAIAVRIDGKDFLWWEDARPISKGSAALIGNQTTVDYDNVVVAQVGQRPIFGLFYAGCYGPMDPTRMPEWTVNGPGNWYCAYETGEHIMQQTSTTGDARAMVGTPTDDQIVTTRARATAFAGSDRWFGVAARYVDASNYYFLSVRNSNTVSLRKVVNGVVTVLGTATVTVRPNTWYDLRLDAVGTELRGFINGAQVVQAIDASHASGQGGLVTFKAAAEYMNYLAWQP